MNFSCTIMKFSNESHTPFLGFIFFFFKKVNLCDMENELELGEHT